MHFIEPVNKLQLKHKEYIHTQHDIVEPQMLRKLWINDINQGTTVKGKDLAKSISLGILSNK